MRSVIYVVGHRSPDTDSVCSAIAYAHLENRCGKPDVRPARAGPVDVETEFVLRHFDVPVPELLTDATGLRLILVDHNEVGQALPHIERAEILEVWEHHRVGDLPLAGPVFFHCEPVGATATLVAEQYAARGVTPTRAMAGMMLASILSDTVIFRSPTTTDKDRVAAARLSPLAAIDPTAFGRQMLEIKVGSSEQLSSREVVRRDFKQFSLSGQRVGISQVEVMRPDAFNDKKAEVFREMRAHREALGLTQLILMITDVGAQGSELWFVGERPELFEQAFGRLEEGAVHLPGTMSRKKQVVPRLSTVFVDESRAPAAGTVIAARSGMPALQNILVPLDGSPPSIAALEHAVALAEDGDATIEVLCVEAPDEFGIGSSTALEAGARRRAEQDAERAIEAAQARLGARVVRRDEVGEPLRKIIEAASDGQHDLIVIGTHGRSGRLHALLGSVTEGVVRNAPCPVLTVREAGGEYQSFAERRHGRASLSEQAPPRHPH